MNTVLAVTDRGHEYRRLLTEVRLGYWVVDADLDQRKIDVHRGESFTRSTSYGLMGGGWQSVVSHLYLSIYPRMKLLFACRVIVWSRLRLVSGSQRWFLMY